MIFGDELPDFLRPLDHDRRAAVHDLLQAQRAALLDVLKPESIYMVEISLVCPPVLLYQYKGWAGHWIQRAPAARNPLREGGLARAQIAFQADHRAGMDQLSQPDSQSLSLLWTVA